VFRGKSRIGHTQITNSLYSGFAIKHSINPAPVVRPRERPHFASLPAIRVATNGFAMMLLPVRAAKADMPRAPWFLLAMAPEVYRGRAMWPQKIALASPRPAT
jgi:hypothetical protein